MCTFIRQGALAKALCFSPMTLLLPSAHPMSSYTLPLNSVNSVCLLRFSPLVTTAVITTSSSSSSLPCCSFSAPAGHLLYLHLYIRRKHCRCHHRPCCMLRVAIEFLPFRGEFHRSPFRRAGPARPLAPAHARPAFIRPRRARRARALLAGEGLIHRRDPRF